MDSQKKIKQYKQENLAFRQNTSKSKVFLLC